MIATAVAFYDVVLWAHILAVVIAFGPPLAYGVFVATAERDGGAAVPSVGRGILAWDRIAGTIGMTVILLSGLYLAADGPWEFSDFFVSWGIVAILVMFGLVHGFLLPRTRQAVEVAERDLGEGDGKLSSDYDSRSAQLARAGALAGLIIVLTIYVMTAKPFL